MRVLAIVLLAVIAGATGVRAQQPNPGASDLVLAEWVDAVIGHTPGMIDEPLQRIGRWAPKMIDQVFERLGAARGLIRNRGISDVDLLKRGALLHTDLAMNPGIVAAPVDAGKSLSARPVVQFGDGNQTGIGQTTDHLDVARRLLALLPRGASHDADVRRWYQATIARQHADEFWDVEQADAAIELFPDAAELLFLNGCLHEVGASPALRVVIEHVSLPFGARLSLGSERDELRKAAAAFKRALALDPTQGEARVHYGHVLLRLGQPGEALSVLRGAAVAVAEPALKYYATMFLGEAAQADGHTDEARAAFTFGVALFPQAQTPRLALSQLAWQAGDRAAARNHLEPLLAASAPDRTADPMFLYPSFQGRRAAEWLADVRTRFMAPAPAQTR